MKTTVSTLRSPFVEAHAGRKPEPQRPKRRFETSEAVGQTSLPMDARHAPRPWDLRAAKIEPHRKMISPAYVERSHQRVEVRLPLSAGCLGTQVAIVAHRGQIGVDIVKPPGELTAKAKREIEVLSRLIRARGFRSSQERSPAAMR